MLRRVMRLPASDRQLLFRLVPIVAAIRAALWVAPLDRIQRRLARHHRPWLMPTTFLQSFAPSRLAWAVVVVSHRVPDASCLTQALALQFLLARSGRSSRLHIGVAHSETKRFQSHAWVECDGQVLIDRPSDVRRYRAIVSWESSPDGCTLLPGSGFAG